MSYDSAFAYLSARGFSDRVHVFDHNIHSCALAADALGVGVAQIAKSMAFHSKEEGEVIMVLAAGDRKFQNGAFKRTFGLKPSFLSPEDTLALVGHPVGGVCPFGVGKNVKVYLDVSLKGHDVVYPACGSVESGVRLTPDELYTLSCALDWVDVTVPLA